ncbi:MAG: hypothetical protein JW730_02855 [Anaerolineales bacterium]|nr:hypothetical protein [Anaerolineales bacterium]
MQKYLHALLVFLMFAWITGSCNYSRPAIASTPNNNSCISPITSLAYPIDGYSKSMQIDQTEPLLPWQVEKDIPQPLPLNQLSYNFIEPQFVRTVRGETEVWLMSTWGAKDDNSFKHTIYVYQTNSKSWHEVSSIIDEVPAEIVHLYLGTDGTIWASASREIGHAYGYSAYAKSTPKFVFGVYDEEKSKFELLDFPERVPLGPIAFNNDKFWIFERYGPIYDVDPRNLQITKYIDPRTSDLAQSMDLPEHLVSSDNALVFMNDESFYFLDDTPKYYTSQDVTLFHFIPEKNTLEAIPSINRLEGGPPYTDLFADRSGNLWVSDFGWMDKTGEWYQLIRSPVFISTKVEATPILWEHPQIVLESSNGLLWFRSTNGMVSLDPQKGEWCWFTTYQSNIVEDSDQNLWMIADNKLYKYPLNP